MTFGKNKGFSLKEIYQYKPNYQASVEKIKEFIINGGATKEIIYAFPNKIFGILELKRKGTYITPKYEDRNKI